MRNVISNFWKNLRVFFLGILEFRSDLTSNPGDDYIETYDKGRDLAHRFTLRRFDN